MPFQISDELVDKLLDKLSTDNDFRDVFQKNPRIAMAYLGHEGATNASPKDQGLWSCAQCKELASPEAIKSSRNQLKTQLLTSLTKLSPVTLDIANSKKE